MNVLPTSFFLLTLLSVSQAVAQDLPLPHVEVPFEQALVRPVDDKHVQLISIVWKPVYETVTFPYTVTQKVTVDGVNPQTNQPQKVEKEVQVEKTGVKTVSKLIADRRVMRIAWPALSANEISGGQVAADELRQRIGKQAVVLRSSSGTIPDEFKVLFKPETLVISYPPGAAFVTPPPRPPDMPPGSPPVALPAAPQEDDSVPLATPSFRLASIDANQQLQLRTPTVQQRQTTCYVTKMETRIVDGKEVSVAVCCPVNCKERYEASHTVKLPLPTTKGATVEGGAMTDRHRTALQAREIPVVVNRDGKTIDSLWLSILKPQMLILSPPPTQPPTMTEKDLPIEPASLAKPTPQPTMP